MEKQRKRFLNKELGRDTICPPCIGVDGYMLGDYIQSITTITLTG